MYKENKNLSRNYLANPHQELLYNEILKKFNSTNLENNRIITDLGNGYDDIKPIDEEKRFN